MTGSKLQRLIEGLQSGDATTITIVVFAVFGTVAIFVVTEIIQHRRKRDKNS